MVSANTMLFTRAKNELDRYWIMRMEGTHTFEETERQRQRFCAVYQVIEDAGLEKEYEKWKNSMAKKGKSCQKRDGR